MALSAVQLGLCFQSYWYMWLTNGLSGLLFIGIDIGIAAFFLKKFGKNKKPANYQRAPSSTAERVHTPSPPNSSKDRVVSPSHVSTRGESTGRPPSRALSTISDDSDSIEGIDDFAYATCEAMNIARQQYGVPPLEVNDQMNDIAQTWANEMARTGKLEHSPPESRNFGRQTLGENFAAKFQAELTPEKMVKRWLKEGRNYKYGSNGGRETENFTQMVWRSSQEIGVGRAKSADGNWWYAVVVFDPPGNIPNQFDTNVLLP